MHAGSPNNCVTTHTTKNSANQEVPHVAPQPQPLHFDAYGMHMHMHPGANLLGCAQTATVYNLLPHTRYATIKDMYLFAKSRKPTSAHWITTTHCATLSYKVLKPASCPAVPAEQPCRCRGTGTFFMIRRHIRLPVLGCPVCTICPTATTDTRLPVLS